MVLKDGVDGRCWWVLMRGVDGWVALRVVLVGGVDVQKEES